MHLQRPARPPVRPLAEEEQPDHGPGGRHRPRRLVRIAGVIDPQVDQVVASQARKQGELAPAQGASQCCLAASRCPNSPPTGPIASPRAMNQSPRSTRFITRNSPARRCQLT